MGSYASHSRLQHLDTCSVHLHHVTQVTSECFATVLAMEQPEQMTRHVVQRHSLGQLSLNVFVIVLYR